VYKQAAIVRPGEYYSLMMRTKALNTFHASYFMILWNVQPTR